MLDETFSESGKQPDPPPSKTRVTVIRLLIVLFCLLAAGYAGFVILASRFEPYARQWIVSALEKRYESAVEIGAFHAALYPIPKASVENVVLRFHNRSGVPPLAKIKRLTLSASLFGLLERPIHVNGVYIEGLEISIPPKEQREAHRENGSSKLKANFVLEKVEADGMLLHLMPADRAKDPRDFEIKTLSLKSAALDRPMNYHAVLTNWKPPGRIESSGHFGPWDASEPGGTPLDGMYTFRDADLSVFKGISGTLSSDGEYHGLLNHIECNGTTDTPNFAVSVGDRPVDLKTQFHAIVDGVNGDTTLNPVNAQFLHSEVMARGTVTGIPPHKGKDITLDVTVGKGRVEDFLHLVVNGPKPLMTGPVSFHTRFQLLPGPRDVIDRLNLKGRFNVPSAQFTNLRVQDILGNISKHAQGKPKKDTDDRVASEFSGDFRLQNATANFSNLLFSIPGAKIQLAGTFGVRSNEIDFEGQARTEARISQMTTGVKSVLLKAVDPFFAKDGAGAVIPIRISGTKNAPKFGLAFHKAKR